MLSEAPADRAGGAAAIGETSYQLGAGMGIALLGSVMNAAYAPGLAKLSGAGVPAEASAAASHSLGEAYQVASQLGGPLGGVLRSAARHAFIDGLHVTLLVSAGLLLLGALAALRLPRVMECPPMEICEPREAAEATAAVETGPRAFSVPQGVPVQGLPKGPPSVPVQRQPAEATGSGRAAH
jgi:DHA2 family multidrug resistance protein-like MFS transporter